MAVSGDDVVVANVVTNSLAYLVSRGGRVGEKNRENLRQVLARVTSETTATDSFDDFEASYIVAANQYPVGLATRELFDDAVYAALAAEPDATP